MSWDIYDETPLDDIYQVSKYGCWGYKGKHGPDQGWKYPNIGDKVKRLIIEYSRKEKLKKLNDN